MNISMPNEISEWEMLIDAFARRLTERYSEEEKKTVMQRHVYFLLTISSHFVNNLMYNINCMRKNMLVRAIISLRE